MAVSGLSLVITIGILNVYHHNPSRPVPSWIRTLILRGLARVLCMHTDDVTPKKNIVRPVDDVHVEDLVDDKKPPVPNNALLPPEILMYVSNLIEKGREADHQDQNREEWIMVGKVLDKTCLVFFMALITITAAVLLPIMDFKGDE